MDCAVPHVGGFRVVLVESSRENVCRALDDVGSALGNLDQQDLVERRTTEFTLYHLVPSTSIADLDEAILLERGNVDAHRARGDCLRYKEEYGRAGADYDTALRLDPEHAPSHRGRGAGLRMKGDFDRAISDFSSALRLNPEDPLACRFRGDAYVARGDYDRAISDFNASLRLDCSEKFAYFGRGNAHLFSGDSNWLSPTSALRSSGILRVLAPSTAGASPAMSWEIRKAPGVTTAGPASWGTTIPPDFSRYTLDAAFEATPS